MGVLGLMVGMNAWSQLVVGGTPLEVRKACIAALVSAVEAAIV